MKVVMLSSDPTILRMGSDARKRMERYAEFFTELHIFVLGTGKDECIGSRLYLYETGAGALRSRFRMYRRLEALLSRSHVDVVSAQAPDEVGFIGYMASRRFGVAFQIQIHADVLSPWYRRASWKGRIRYWISLFLIPRADCIRVVSRRIRDSIIRLPGISAERISVLPIYTDLRAFLRAGGVSEERELASKEFRMCTAGRFVEKEKNILLLIRMMTDIASRIPNATLHIIGEGPDRYLYEEEIRRSCLGERVILEKWRFDLADYFRSFDIFLLPSYHEGWGRVVLEAMAAGLPIVMTDVGLAGEVVKDGMHGMVVPVGDREAFRSAVESLYRDTDLCLRVSRTNRETARSLLEDESEYLRRYQEVFRSCVS